MRGVVWSHRLRGPHRSPLGSARFRPPRSTASAPFPARRRRVSGRLRCVRAHSDPRAGASGRSPDCGSGGAGPGVVGRPASSPGAMMPALTRSGWRRTFDSTGWRNPRSSPRPSELVAATRVRQLLRQPSCPAVSGWRASSSRSACAQQTSWRRSFALRASGHSSRRRMACAEATSSPFASLQPWRPASCFASPFQPDGAVAWLAHARAEAEEAHAHAPPSAFRACLLAEVRR